MLHPKYTELGKLLKDYFDYVRGSLTIVTILLFINFFSDRIDNITVINLLHAFFFAILAWMWFSFYDFKIKGWKVYVEIREILNRQLNVEDEKIIKNIP